MNEKTFLAISRNGKRVYYDPVHSHTATHLADTPQLEALAREIIDRTTLEGPRLAFDTDLGRTVGKTDLVENKPGDAIVYAKRRNRDIYTAFNKTQKPHRCTVVALILELTPQGNYELVSAWIGSGNTPPFPGDEHETDESKPFWSSHSLAWGTQAVQAGTETSVCPW